MTEIPGIKTSEDETIVRRVADSVIQETTFRLRDTADGRTFDSSRDLSPSATIIVDSRFNAWSNRSCMVLQGMTRLGRVLRDERYHQFQKQCLAFTVRYLPFFQKQYDMGLKTPRSGETPGGGMGLYFEWDELWMTGLAPLWIEQTGFRQNTIYTDYTRRFARFIDCCQRVDDGLLADRKTLIIACSSYMTFPAMIRLARLENSPAARLDDAVRQELGYHRRLFQESDELYYRVWDAGSKEYQSTYWGRGGGWMALTHIEFLAELPPDDPRHAQVLANYQAQMRGLRRWQAEDGGWHQVMDHEESWIETSCTGMFTYAIARGVNEGWLDPSFKADALLAWKSLTAKVSSSGMLVDTCPGTEPGDLEHYLSRPRKEDDPHAYGPFLLAGAEMLRMLADKKYDGPGAPVSAGKSKRISE